MTTEADTIPIQVYLKAVAERLKEMNKQTIKNRINESTQRNKQWQKDKVHRLTITSKALTHFTNLCKLIIKVMIKQTDH